MALAAILQTLVPGLRSLYCLNKQRLVVHYKVDASGIRFFDTVTLYEIVLKTASN